MHPLEPIARSSSCPPPSKEGFSLLELLLVVAILSSVAFVVTSTVTNDVSQVRYEDTRNRLTAIRRAIVGSSNPELWAKGLQSGYVVDNGRLPENIKALVTIPDSEDAHVDVSYHPYGLYIPYFDPTPNEVMDGYKISDGSNDPFPLPASGHLMKGHRGSYLLGALQGEYRDGWGTRRSSGGEDSLTSPSADEYGYGTAESDDDDDYNFGWVVTVNEPTKKLHHDEFYVDSFGMDGEKGEASGLSNYQAYEEDVLMEPPVFSGDWEVDIAGRSVKVYNKTGYDLDLKNAEFYASILVYLNGNVHEDPSIDVSVSRNDAGRYEAPSNWRRVDAMGPADTSLPDDDPGPLSVKYLDGNGDGYVVVDANDPEDTQGAESYFELTFPSDTAPIPAGEHLLILVYAPDDDEEEETPNLEGLEIPEYYNKDGSGGETKWDDWIPPEYVTKRVKFYARGGVPDLVLEIR